MSKLALLIGINYQGSDSPLKGCINDVKAMRKYLIEKRGYNKDNITVLRDDIDGINPTRDNILYYLGNLIYQANTNNSEEIFFHFSGHGDNDQPSIDITGEKDNKNEYIVTSDLDIVFDNEIRETIGGTGENGTPALNSNTIMYIIMDCCRSGTNTDLPYVYDVKNGKLRKIQDYKQDITNYDNKTVYSISGCSDSDFSTDGPLYAPFTDQNDSNYTITPNERAGGLLTITLLKLLNSNLGYTYLNCLRKLRTDIQNYGKNIGETKIQQPLLSSSIPVNVTLK